MRSSCRKLRLVPCPLLLLLLLLPARCSLLFLPQPLPLPLGKLSLRRSEQLPPPLLGCEHLLGCLGATAGLTVQLLLLAALSSCCTFAQRGQFAAVAILIIAAALFLVAARSLYAW